MLIEQKLIKRIKKKQDKEAANALISYYYKEVYAYVYRQTGNEELTKDLTQDIFIQILQKITIFDHKKASFRTWMYRIASNKICDHYRSKVHCLSLKQEQIDMTDENLELHSGNLGTAVRDLSELIIHKELIEDIMEIVSLYKQECGVLPVKRTIKNNKFLYRQPCYGWRYFMLLLRIVYDIPLVSLHVVFFEVVHCCNNLCN